MGRSAGPDSRSVTGDGYGLKPGIVRTRETLHNLCPAFDTFQLRQTKACADFCLLGGRYRVLDMELLIGLPILALLGLFAGGGGGGADPDPETDPDPDPDPETDPQDELIRGGARNDDFRGGQGEDTIYGAGGNDQIRGGNDNDLLYGGTSNDNIHGQYGDDSLYGGVGNDYLSGGEGDDFVNAGGGNDTVAIGAEAGSDRVLLGTGADLVFGLNSASGHTVSGMGGDDVISLGSGDDVVYGGSGNDLINTGAGADVLIGGAGNDTLVSYAPDSGDTSGSVLNGGFGNDSLQGDANDTLIGGEGADSLIVHADYDLEAGVARVEDYVPTTDQLILSLSDFGPGPDIAIRALDGGTMISAAGRDVCFLAGVAPADIDMEDIRILPVTSLDFMRVGTNGDDLMRGTTGPDGLNGVLGDDTLFGGDGSDILYGGGGEDSLEGDNGNDLLYGAGWLSGGAGADSIFGGGNLYGGSGNDFIRVEGDAVNEVNAGAGDDTVVTWSSAEVTLGVGADHLFADLTGDEPVTVTDFNLAQDQMDILFLTADAVVAPATDPLGGVTLQNVTGGVQVMLGARLLATIEGVNASALRLVGSQVNLEDDPDLEPIIATNIQVRAA